MKSDTNSCTRRNMLKILSLSASAGIISYLSGCCCFLSQPKLRYASDLGISDHPDYPIVRMSQSEGEERLLDLAKTATKEEGWAMFPSEDSCTWYDVGYMQSYGRYYLNSDVIDNILKAECTSAGYTRSPVFYHIHPLKTIIKQAREITSDLDIPSPTLNQTQFEMLSIPSGNDIIQHIQRKIEFRRYYRCAIQESKVVSPLGIYTYRTSDEINETNIDRTLKSAIDAGFENTSLEVLLNICAENGIMVEYERRRYLNQPIKL